jgi:hypothetical protein
MSNSVLFLPEFGHSLIIEITYLIFTFLAGSIFLSLFKKGVFNNHKDFPEIFLSLFLGIIFIGVLTAVIVSRGKTIFSFSPLILVLFFWSTKSTYKTISKKLQPLDLKLSSWITLVLVVNALAFSLTFFFLITKTNGGLNCDQVFYGQVSYALGHTGIETTNFSWLRESVNLNPYHYLELWYVSFAQKIFTLGPGVYVLIWYPISITLVFLGIASLSQMIFNKIIPQNLKIIYIILGSIFFFVLTPGNKIFSGSNNFDDLKTGLATSLIILVCYTYYTKGINLALWVSLTMIFIYLPLAPAIYSGVVCVSIYNWISDKSDKSVSAFQLISMITVIALFIGFYYLTGFFPTSYLTHQEANHENFPRLITNFFIQFGKDIIKLFFYFTPVIFITFLISIISKSLTIWHDIFQFFRRNKAVLVFLISGLVLSKIFSLIAENFNPDVFQIYTLFYTKIISIGLFSLIIYLTVRYLRASKVFFILTTCLIVTYYSFTIINSPSPHFFKPASEKFETKFWTDIYNTVARDDKEFVYLSNDNVEKNEFERNELLVYPMQRMIWIRNNFFPVNLHKTLAILNNIPLIKNGIYSYNSTDKTNLIKQDPLLVFNEEFDFVKKYKVGYLILETGAYLDPHWDEFIARRISCDEYSLLCLNDLK